MSHNDLNQLNLSDTIPQRIPQQEYLLQQDKIRGEAMNRMLNQLKIPDAVKDLPQYAGTKNGLYNFIQNVEGILSICMEACQNNPNYCKLIVRAIRNKIVGDANDALEMYNSDGSWEEIRNSLISHYADKRDETSLIRDLHKITQGYDTIERYFSRISDILNSLNNWAKLNTLIEQHRDIIISAKRNWYHSMCLSVFLAGLSEPLGPMVRAMQPPNLQTARAYCLKEQNITYLKMRPLNPKPVPPRLPYKPQLNQYNPTFKYSNYQPLPRNPYQQPQYYNHRPFTHQNPLPPNRQLMPPKPQRYNRPEPMDTSSITDKYKQPTYEQKPFQSKPTFQYQQRPPFQFQQTGPPRFKSQELFNIEYNPEVDYYPNEDYQEYYEYSQPIDTSIENPLTSDLTPIQDIVQNNYYPSLEAEIQDEDFHLDASNNQSDT